MPRHRYVRLPDPWPVCGERADRTGRGKTERHLSKGPSSVHPSSQAVWREWPSRQSYLPEEINNHLPPLRKGIKQRVAILVIARQQPVWSQAWLSIFDEQLSNMPLTNCNLCFTIYTRSAKEDLFGGMCDSVSGTGRHGSA